MDRRIFSWVNLGLLAALTARFVLNAVLGLLTRLLPTSLAILGVVFEFAVVLGAPALGGYIAARLRPSSGMKDALWVGIGLVIVQAAVGLLLPGMVDMGWGLFISASITIPAALLGGYIAGAGLSSSLNRNTSADSDAPA